MKYVIAFKDYKNEKELRLPVLPEEIEVSIGKNLETSIILKKGEVDFPYGSRVEVVRFNSLFPAEFDPSYCEYTPIPDPIYCVDLIRDWNEKFTPVVFGITNFIDNNYYYISEFNYKLKGGTIGDVYYDITLRKYREIKIGVKNEEKPRVKANDSNVPRVDSKSIPSKYIVKTGDTLSIIAKKLYGDSQYWTKIYEANKKIIGNDPNKIKEGMVLVIPSVQK